MRRPVWLVAMGLFLMAAASGKPSAPDVDDFPIPPIPPAFVPPYQTAPIPDTDAKGPGRHEADVTRVQPGFFSQKEFNAGQGYLSGSTVQGQQEQRLKPMPSLNLKVPLQ